MKYRKMSSIPAKADPAKQSSFLNDTLNPLIEQAKNGVIELLFCDAMHCVMSVFLSYLWSFQRIFIKSSPGRQRLNVVGAVNAITKKITCLFNDTYVNAETMKDFLIQLKAEYVLKPIYVVLDNARYQHCQMVIDMAKELDIHLIFLPAYSPNLNIIERLWKFTKKECLNGKYFDNFKLFSDCIKNMLLNANQLKQKELESLLTLKFQTFGDS